MLERGDLVCVHEPFSDIAGLGETDVAGRPFAAADELLAWLRDESRAIDVFLKDTPGPRQTEVISDRRFLGAARHAFLIRRPEEIAASSYAVEPNITVDSLGLEHLHALLAAVREADGLAVVLDSDDLVDRPAATMAAYCASVGLPFVPDALAWQPADRPEWRRSARWHVAVSESSGFERRDRRYAHTVENDDVLARIAAHHRPFYEDLHGQRLVVPPE